MSQRKCKIISKRNKSWEPEVLESCHWINHANEQDIIYYAKAMEPMLVLYKPLNESYKSIERYKSNTTRTWTKFFHQTGGYMCCHKYIFAYFLPPKDEIKKLMQTLAKEWYECCLSVNVSLQDINKYESLIQKYGLTCNYSYNELQEGFYPIDIGCAKNVTLELIEELNTNKKDWMSLTNKYEFGLAILTENCD